MEGVATYSGTILTINVDKTNGSGTIASWNLGVAGQPGAGDLSSVNNLSDLANKKTALDNISIHSADVASASAINLEGATGDLVDVTGNAVVTAITLSEGHERTVRFTGTSTLTHGASLVLPGAVSITTSAGDFAVFRGYASGVVRCVEYSKASGNPVAAADALATYLRTGTGAEGVLRSKIVSFTINMSLTSGAISYTGVGFKPSAIILLAGINSGGVASRNTFSMGFADSSKALAGVSSYGDDTHLRVSPTSSPLTIYQGDNTAANYQNGVLTSFDADGFTITWTKTGSPDGYIPTINALCLR